MFVDVTAHFRELAPSLPPTENRRPSAFVVEAVDTLNCLIELENLLSRIKPKYLFPRSFILTKRSPISEDDKDELDADLVELIKNCSNRIDTLKKVVEAQPAMSNAGEYQREVVAYLLERLKSIADAAKKMQKERYQQPFLLSPRLLPQEERNELDVLEQKIVQQNKDEAKKQQAKAERLKSSSKPTPAVTSALSEELSKPEIRQRKSGSAIHNDLEFTEEDDRRFQVENVKLHRHFQENLEDAKQMESKMVEISNLMSQFADKIMEQQSDIELIQHHAQETKVNVFQSNRILAQTEKIGKGYGFFIFCFYVGFSMLLHMLHYFND